MSTPPKKILSLKQKKLKLQSTPAPSSTPSQSYSDTQQPKITKVKEEETCSSVLPLSGLCNLGNTCYANCILQVLRFCPRFSAEMAKFCENCFGSPSAEVKAGEREGEQGTLTSMEWEDEGVEEEGALVTSLNLVSL